MGSRRNTSPIPGREAYQVVELIVLDYVVSSRPFASVAAASNTMQMLINPPAATQQHDQAASGHAGLAPNVAFPTEPRHFGQAQAELLDAEPPELVSLLGLAESGGASSSSAASSSRSAVLQLLAAVPTAAAQASAATARPDGVEAHAGAAVLRDGGDDEEWLVLAARGILRRGAVGVAKHGPR